MDRLFSHQKESNGSQLDGCEHPPGEKQSQSALWSSKRSYAAVLCSLCFHTLVIFSMPNLASPPAPPEMRPFFFYTAYLTDLESDISGTVDNSANKGAGRILPESPEIEHRDARSLAPPDVKESANPRSQPDQSQLTTPAVIPAPAPSVKKLVSIRKKLQPTPEITREHDTVKPNNAPNGAESLGGEITPASEPQKSLKTAPAAKKQSGNQVDHPARDLDREQFLAANMEDIGSKVMAVLQYPAIAKRMKWQGLSSIGFVLHPSGEVTRLTVEKSSGHEILDKQAIAAVKAAAPFRGAPDEISVILPVRFRLD